MSLIQIKGQDYETAWSRIMRFRSAHPLWSIVTEIVVDDGKRVLVRASLLEETGRVIATGSAEEIRGSSNINSTSCIENTETSAIARCLGIAGWNEAEQLATAEEVSQEIEQQEKTGQAERLEKARKLFESMDLDPDRRREVDACLDRGDLPRLTALYSAEKSRSARIATNAPESRGNGKGDNIPQEWKDESLRASGRDRG